MMLHEFSALLGIVFSWNFYDGGLVFILLVYLS